VSGRRPRGHHFDAKGWRRLFHLDFDGCATMPRRNEIGGLANGFAIALPFSIFISLALSGIGENCISTREHGGNAERQGKTRA
jgi:hypothetical protein